MTGHRFASRGVVILARLSIERGRGENVCLPRIYYTKCDFQILDTCVIMGLQRDRVRMACHEGCSVSSLYHSSLIECLAKKHKSYSLHPFLSSSQHTHLGLRSPSVSVPDDTTTCVVPLPAILLRRSVPATAADVVARLSPSLAESM